MAALSRSGHPLLAVRKIQLPFPAPHWKRKPTCSDLGVLGKRKCVFHVDPKVADGIIDLAMAEEDLDSTKVASRPIDDRRLGTPKRVGAILTSYQTHSRYLFIHEASILAGAEMPSTVTRLGKT
jgi:hypothetical protein